MIDNKTPRPGFPLPDVDNHREDDVGRLGQAPAMHDGLVATVGEDGKIPVSQSPAVAPTNVFPVATEGEMRQLNARVGAVAIRSDINKSFILMAEPASVLANWKELPNDALKTLAQLDGLESIGRCADIAELRTIEPTAAGQVINVAVYKKGRLYGGGDFEYDATDTTSADNGGTVIVTTKGMKRWKRVLDRGARLTPFMFGCVSGTQYSVDNSNMLQAMINAANGGAVDLSAGPWFVKKTVDFTPCSVVYGDQYARLVVDPANFTGTWVATFGRDNGDNKTERWARGSIIGWFEVVCGSRKAPLNGIFIKGSWLNIQHIRASGFNGTGISESAVWDSTFTRVMTERCGNLTAYAYRCEKYGDTHNASAHLSIQCEQAYHRGIYIEAVRDTFNNIHAERLMVMSTDDGSSTISGLKYVNHSITLGNGSINQIIMDCDTVDSTTHEVVGVTTAGNMILNLDRSSIHDAQISMTVNTSFGMSGKYNGLRGTSWYIKAPVKQLHATGCEMSNTIAAEARCTFDRCVTGTFMLLYNALDVVWREGSITTIAFDDDDIQGDIYFYNINYTGTIGDTKSPTGQAQPVTFVNCRLATLSGAYQGWVRIIGGYIGTVSLASRAYAEFRDVLINTFSYVGDAAYITWNCQCANTTKWTTPAYGPWPSGTLTARLGPGAAATPVFYVSTGGSTAPWVGIASRP